MRSFALLAALTLTALVVLAPGIGRAHSISFGVLRVVEEPGGARVVLRAGGREGSPPVLALEVVGQGCVLHGGPPSYDEAQVLLQGQLRCSAGLEGALLRVHGVDEELHLAVRIERLDGSVQSGLLDATDAEIAVLAAPSSIDVMARYGALGVEHILLGLDHLLFLVALLLVALVGARDGGARDGARPVRRVLLAVTGFTLGHSATLSLAALGALSLPSAPVEVCIALSIVLLGAELVRASSPARAGPSGGATFRWPGLVAAGFGLLHGLGFAGALAEHGLPAGQGVLALVSFNLGVELGQLAFVALLFAPLARIRARSAEARSCMTRRRAVCAAGSGGTVLNAECSRRIRGRAHGPTAVRWAARAIGAAGAVWLGARLHLWLA